MCNITRIIQPLRAGILFLILSTGVNGFSQSNVISISGKRFLMNDKEFEFTGISFFNAIYNPEFNKSEVIRQEYIGRFNDHGINVLRIWCQWDSDRGFADAGAGKTIYNTNGNLNDTYLSTLKRIIEDANKKKTVILLVLFSRESWNENKRLSDDASEVAVRNITNELKNYRNLIFQIWNEFDYRTVDYCKIIKSIDSQRIVTNSPGYAGVLGSIDENMVLDYLSPHTTRDDEKHWEVAESEIKYLLNKYDKPVVDDEPARRGTPKYGGPKTEVYPYDHIIHIYKVWETGGYIVYHHDMFQTGYGNIDVPPSGIPVSGFSNYHDQVFNFLKLKDRYLKHIR